MAHRKIDRKRYFILVVFIGIAMCSCSPCERLAKRCPPIEYVRDSIVVYDTFTRESIITDTLLYVRLIPEHVYVKTPVTDTANGETSYTNGMAWVNGDRVMLIMKNKDSAEVLAKKIETLERQVKYWKQHKEKVTVKTEYRTRGIVKVGAWIGLAAVVLLLLRIVVFIAGRK